MSDELKAVPDEQKTAAEPRQKPKKALERSETWLTLITALGAMATAMVGQHPGSVTLVSAFVLVLSVGVYAFYKTDLPSRKSGVKTKAFWASIATVVGSVALALSEADLPGLPAGVTKYAALISTLLTAAGYTIIRYNAKTKN
jgi:hypothetical protein